MADVSVSAKKEKTKSKIRYLKRKKERRKVRTKPTPGKSSQLGIETAAGAKEGDFQEEENGPANQAEGMVVDLTARDKHPKKRRRLQDEEQVQKSPAQSFTDIASEAHEEAQSTLTEHRRLASPEIIGTLPSFPLPALPNPPSKTDLALQGLDKALIDAEIVSPTTTLLVPFGSDHGGTRLGEHLRKRLRDIGVTELFAEAKVQTKLLPFLIPEDQTYRTMYLPFDPPRDVCVSAPTGSGKTLAYVLPIVEILSTRIVTRLRALIVLPTRDLVTQVRETIGALSKGTSLKVGSATGQHSFSQEQTQLVSDQVNNLEGGSSRVDILICTPGRLIDHIVGTPNFSLQHLRFLVIDEADRLLAQSFQDWLARVLAATRPSAGFESETLVPSQRDPFDFTGFLPDALSPAFLQASQLVSSPSFFLEPASSSCQKLLFSATLTRDPGKISALELRNPKYFVVQGSDAVKVSAPDAQALTGIVLDVAMERFSMPATLSEHMVVTETSQKPLVFFHLVNARQVTNALVFTKSAESTSRLVRLFEFFEEDICGGFNGSHKTRRVIKAYSSDLPVAERKAILEQFKKQDVHILVCSDLISRGIDISHVSHVVSYDVPVDMRKYVHRVGRTARAGKHGDAWTLVEEQEARHFKQMVKQAGHFERINRLRISVKELDPLVPHYEVALNKLKDAYSRHT